MDANQAKRQTANAKARQREIAEEEARHRRAAEERERVRALRDDFPKYLETCYKEIEKEAKGGGNSVRIKTTWWHRAVGDRVKDVLQGEGYNVTAGSYAYRRSGIDDFDDSNNGWEYWLDISW